MHERRRPAPVEVDRVARAEGQHQPREFAEFEAGVDAGAAAVAADGQELPVADAERAARMALEVMSESNCRSRPRSPRGHSSSTTTAPSRTSSGPACTRSPGGSAATLRAGRAAPRRPRGHHARADPRRRHRLVRHARAADGPRRAAGTGRARRTRPPSPPRGRSRRTTGRVAAAVVKQATLTRVRAIGWRTSRRSSRRRPACGTAAARRRGRRPSRCVRCRIPANAAAEPTPGRERRWRSANRRSRRRGVRAVRRTAGPHDCRSSPRR